MGEIESGGNAKNRQPLGQLCREVTTNPSECPIAGRAGRIFMAKTPFPQQGRRGGGVARSGTWGAARCRLALPERGDFRFETGETLVQLRG